MLNTALMFTITLRYHESNKSRASYHTSQICSRSYLLSSQTIGKIIKQKDQKRPLTKYSSSWVRSTMEWRECRWQGHYLIRIAYQLLGSWFLHFCFIIAMILQTKLNQIILILSFLYLLLNVSTIIKVMKNYREK